MLKRNSSDWDSSSISYTKDCRKGCEWYRKITEQGYCGWGVAYKLLEKTRKPRKCSKKDKLPQDAFFRSVRYLDQVIEEVKENP